VSERADTLPALAYLTSLYPRASDTFIRREVAALRRLGHRVETFSVRAPDAGQIVGADVEKEANQTTSLLDNPAALPLDLAWAIATRPAALRRAARAIWRIGPGGARARVWQTAYLAEACRLARALRRRRIDILHNHIGENSATVAMAASIISGVPFSQTIHGPGIFFSAERWGLGEKIDRSAFTACISDFCRSQCMIFAPLRSWERLRIIRCGLDERFFDERATSPSGEARIVCVGRLCEAKGQALLIDAVARLRDEGVACACRLVGDGPMRRALEKRIAERGVGDRVEILGWLSGERVREELDAARLFVLPSFAEGLPVVIMEALAMGRPVVSTRIAAIPELVRPAETGWLCAPGSVDALVEALRDALATPIDRLAEMGRRGRDRVLERHDVTREAARLSELFGRVARGEPLPADTVTERTPASGGGGAPAAALEADAPAPVIGRRAG